MDDEQPLLNNNGDSTDSSSSKSMLNRKLVFSSFVMLLGAVCTGIMLGLSSPLIPEIQDDKSSKRIQPKVTDDQASWIGSLLTLGGILGGLVGSASMKYGRKATAVFSGIPYLAGLLLISFGTNVAMLYAGRFISGVGMGMTSLCVPTYQSEVAPTSLRGLFSSGNQLSICIGLFFAYLIGDAFGADWRTFVLVLCIFSTVFCILTLFIPESPRYLYASNRKGEATKQLFWLRDDEEQCQKELEEMEESVASSSESTWKEVFTTSSILKPFSIAMTLMFFQQFCGVNALLFYLADIFKSAGFDTPEKQDLASLLVAGLQVVATLVSAVIVDKAGRKLLLILSSSVMCVSLVTFGLYYQLKPQQPDNDSYLSWLSLSSMIVYIIAFSIGVGPIPWVSMSELLPNRARSKCGGNVTSFNILCAFIVTKFFSSLEQAITKQGAFWFFAGMCILLLLFVVFIVPETKGKTLEEIEKIFDNNSNGTARDEANNLLDQVKNLDQDSSYQDYGSTR